MKPYPDKSGESGVTHYELGKDWIEIRFAGRPEPYRYSARGIGNGHLDALKRLAEAGQGLATYISQNPEVRDGYD